MSQMSSVMQWDSLLGLPLEMALEKTREAGVEPEVVQTTAPRREPVSGATLRVIRVRNAQDSLQLTVSAFVDGDPRKG